MTPDDGPRPDQAAGVLASKIRHLIEVMYPEQERRPGFASLAEEIRRATGARLSGTYLWELTTGRKRNPTVDQVAVLARFFGVPPEYFFNDAAARRVDSQIRLALALRDSRVREIALRAEGLSPRSLDSILVMIDEVRKIQDLATHPEPDDATPDDAMSDNAMSDNAAPDDAAPGN